MKPLKFTLLSAIVLVYGFVNISNAQWVQTANEIGISTNVYSIVNSGTTLFAGTQTGVYVSSNNGANWIQTPLNNRYVYSLAVDGNNIIAGTQNDYGAYKSTDMGATWNQTSMDHRFVYSLLVNGGNIFAGTEYNNIPMGVYVSTNGGTTWTPTSFNNKTVRSLAASGNNIYAGTETDGVYLSTDNGATWAQTSFNNLPVYSLLVSGNKIFAGTVSNGIYLSTNNGTTWAPTSLVSQTVYTFAIMGNNIFIGTYQNGVFVSNDNGTSWTGRSEGFPNGSSVYSLNILNNNIFAGTNGAGSLYRRPIGELAGIQLISNEIPEQFSLSQNYPNPFNPTTKINFNIPKSGNVEIKIFDITGKNVETVYNGFKSAGKYSLDFDGSKLGSGVYFYRLTTGEFSASKKMVLVK